LTCHDQQSLELTDEPAELFVTMICGQPAVTLATLNTLLGCLSDLLDAVGTSLYPENAPVWCVADVLAGFSETTERQRIAIELLAAPEARAVADRVLAGIQQLRTLPVMPDKFTRAALTALAGLAQVLDQRVDELWFSRPGETPAFVTAATREVIAELAG
jgi:hypothetical protein